VNSLDPCTREQLAPLYSPLIQITAQPDPVDMRASDAAIFTSANGVLHAPPGQGRAAFCVGTATTAAARAKGWNAQHAGDDADGLVATIAQIAPGQRLFHLSGTHTRGNITQRLSQAGLSTAHHAVYDQILCPLTPDAMTCLHGGKPAIVPLFSPRTAAHFASQINDLGSVHVVALSPAVADAIQGKLVASLTVVPHPNAQAMGAAIATLL